MKSLLYHAFGLRDYRYLRTRYEGGRVIFELEPEIEPLPPDGQKLRRHGFRWRTLRTVSIGLKPVVLRVKVPRWQNTTTGAEFEQSPPLPSRIRKSPARSRG
jgi:hypothetical protein